MADAARAHGGRYDLPHQLHATQSQFDAADPEAATLRSIKGAHDPSGRFANELWRRYL